MSNGSRKIMLEDLLRLKRAERPPPEFWGQFDAQMRAKQLAAIVVRRPWWDGLSRVFSRSHRVILPAGAVAALGLVWVGVHRLSPSAPPAVPVLVQPALGASVATAPALPIMTVVAQVDARPAKVEEGGDRLETEVVIPASQPSSPSHLTKVPDAAQVASLYGSPFAEGMAATLADFRALDADLAKRSAFGAERDMETVSGRQPMSEPLTRVDPAQERLQRLLAPALPAYTYSNAARTFTSERQRDRASDDRMYESMDRPSSGGMSLEFRF
jgi:hypothetical protein